MNALLTGVENLNMAVHLNGIDIQSPPVLTSFFAFIFEMVTYDFLPVDVIWDYLTGLPMKPPTEILGSIGYEDSSPVRNMGSVFIGLAIIPIGIVYLFLYAKIKSYFVCCNKTRNYNCCKFETPH
jgi:hypothetical protein